MAARVTVTIFLFYAFCLSSSNHFCFFQPILWFSWILREFTAYLASVFRNWKYVLNSRLSHCFGNRFRMHLNMNISSNEDMSIDSWNNSAWNLIYFPWISVEKKKWWLKCFIRHEIPLIFAALWHHFFIRIVARRRWEEKNARKKTRFQIDR